MWKLFSVLPLLVCTASGLLNLKVKVGLAPEGPEGIRDVGDYCFATRECKGSLKCVNNICSSPCDRVVCGRNSFCSAKDNEAQCNCLKGFSGDALKGCEPDEENKCRSNRQCPNGEECVNGDCVDPCQYITCGKDALCIGKDHVGKCVCKSGSKGDPNKECIPEEEGDKSCTNQIHCPKDQMCFKMTCVDPCTVMCGPNTDCVVKDHSAICACKPGYEGDPKAGCFEDEEECDDQECLGHDNCPHDITCIENTCQNPCDGLCGKNTVCSVFNHYPICECLKGYSGNPLLGCNAGGGGKNETGGGGEDDGKGGKDEKGNKGDQDGKGGKTKGGRGVGCLGTWPPPNAGKKKYLVDTSKSLDWNGAYIHCHKRGQRLATIDTIDEYNEVDYLLRNTTRNSYFWIGGIGRGKNEIPWTWMATGEKINPRVEKWITNNPDNAYYQEHCLLMQEGWSTGYNWNDVLCYYKYHFVCEYYDD